MYSNRGIEEATGALHAAVTDLHQHPLTPLSDDGVLTVMRQVEQCTRMLVSVQNRLLVEANERSLPARHGVASLTKFLAQTLRLASADAGARVKQAGWVATFHDMSGDPVPPQLPHTAEAMADGDISGDHANGIAAVMNRIPHRASADDREAAEHILAGFARTSSPDDIGKVGERILAHLDPDGCLTTDTDRARMRGVMIGRQRADGMSLIRGDIDPVLRALLDPLLAKYARPGRGNPDDQASPPLDPDRADSSTLAAAAARDRRSSAQRNHDALKTLLRSGVVADRLGAHRGVPVTTILTMKADELDTLAGVATTATGGAVPIGDALTLIQRSQPWLAVFDHAGMPLHLGRTKRLASREQRLALIAALHGCSRPGCDAPASMCAVHHVLDYRKNGTTDLTNLTLACDSCHALIHDGPGGWKTSTGGAQSPYAGRIAWTAPPHIDPDQVPRINHRHRANELLAEAVTRIHVRNGHIHDHYQQGVRAHSPPPTAA